jgi:hypothetical protein
MGNSLDGCCMSQVDDKNPFPSTRSAKIITSNPDPNGSSPEGSISRLDQLENIRHSAQFFSGTHAQMSADQRSSEEMAYYEEIGDDSSALGRRNNFRMQQTSLYGNNVDSDAHHPTPAQYSESIYSPRSGQLRRSTRFADQPDSSPNRSELAVGFPINIAPQPLPPWAMAMNSGEEYATVLGSTLTPPRIESTWIIATTLVWRTSPPTPTSLRLTPTASPPQTRPPQRRQTTPIRLRSSSHRRQLAFRRRRRRPGGGDGGSGRRRDPHVDPAPRIAE